MATKSAIQLRKIKLGEKLGLLHESSFDLVELAHPGPTTIEDAPHKAKRRTMLCLMIDVAINYKLRNGALYSSKAKELASIYEMDK